MGSAYILLLSQKEAAKRRRELIQMVLDGQDPEEVLEYEEGLEPDYIFDIIPTVILGK